MTPARMLGRAIAGLQSGLLPDDVRVWLREGLYSHRAGGGRLDVCLGLKPTSGKRLPASAAIMDHRDGQICAVASVMIGQEWEKAGKIADFFADRDTGSLPNPAMNIALRLMGSGVRLPKSQGHILRILGGNRSA